MNNPTLPSDVLKDLKTIQTLCDEQFKNDEEIFRLSLENEKLQREMGLIQWRESEKEIQRLRDEKTVNEKKIAQLRERQRCCEIQLKICEKLMKEYERKQRNRRIFTRGGMLEAFLLEPLLLTNEEVHDFLQTVFRMPEVDSLLRRLIRFTIWTKMGSGSNFRPANGKAIRKTRSIGMTGGKRKSGAVHGQRFATGISNAPGAKNVSTFVHTSGRDGRNFRQFISVRQSRILKRRVSPRKSGIITGRLRRTIPNCPAYGN